MNLCTHYYAPRAWNNPEAGPPPEGWYLVDDDYPLHIYPICGGPYNSPDDAARDIPRIAAIMKKEMERCPS